MMKRRFGILLLCASAVVALATGIRTWAISGATIDRAPGASLTADASAGVQLGGWNNTPYVTTTTFAAAGTIKNSFNENVTFTVSMDPNITSACKSVSGGTCTNGAWTLYLCLAADQTSAGKTTCSATGGASLRTFTGTGTSNPAPQSFPAFTLTAGQTRYLLARAVVTSATGTAQLCGETMLSLSGTGAKQQSVVLSHSATVPRRIVLRLGSGCP